MQLRIKRIKRCIGLLSKDHLRLPSFSLVPQNDPSILLINAGMIPQSHTLQVVKFRRQSVLPCQSVFVHQI